MKILKNLIITLVALILVLIAAAVIFVKTFDLNRYKPQIIEQANKALGRQVDFKNAALALSLRQGISVKINDLSVAEDPAFGKGEFLEVKNISLGVDVLAYLFRKEINIPGILINSPRVTIIRQKDGSLNVQTIAKPAQPQKQAYTPSLPTASNLAFAAAPEPAAAAVAIPALLISSVKCTDGTLAYIDRTFEPPMQFAVEKLDFQANKISLTNAFPFMAEAAFLSNRQNIKIEGKAQLNLKTNEVTISGLKAATELSQINIDKIASLIPAAQNVILPTALKGKVEVAGNKLTAGPKGLSSLNITGSLTNGLLQFKELAQPVKDVAAVIKITEDKVSLEKLSANISEGSIEVSGAITDYLNKQDYDFSASIQNLNIKELINQEAQPVKAEGVTSARIKVSGTGFSPQNIYSNLSGSGNVSVVKLRLKDINILRAVLDKISIIPGLSEKVQSGLSERFKEKLTQKDTVFSDINLPLAVENGRLLIKDAALEADEFMFKGDGQAALNGAFSLEGSFLIPQELSASMVSAVSQLQYLLNDNNQIYIPLKISGRAGAEPKFSVDAEYIATKVLVEQGKKQLFNAIDKALGGKQEPQPQEQGQGTQQPQATEEKPSTEKAVGDILRGIFK